MSLQRVLIFYCTIVSARNFVGYSFISQSYSVDKNYFHDKSSIRQLLRRLAEDRLKNLPELEIAFKLLLRLILIFQFQISVQLLEKCVVP